MVALVTIDEVKLRLKIDSDAEDDDLQLAINAASEAVLDYMKLPYDHFDDSSGGTADEVPATVKNAVITLVGIWKRDPSGAELEKWQQGYLPFAVTAQIYRYRDPTLQ